jgi:hypothetical protein
LQVRLIALQRHVTLRRCDVVNLFGRFDDATTCRIGTAVQCEAGAAGCDHAKDASAGTSDLDATSALDYRRGRCRIASTSMLDSAFFSEFGKVRTDPIVKARQIMRETFAADVLRQTMQAMEDQTPVTCGRVHACFVLKT